MFISVERYGLSWLARPVVAILFTIAIIGLVRPFLQDIRSQGGPVKMLSSFQAPRFRPEQLFTMFIIAVIGTMVLVATGWGFSAKIVPLVVGTIALSMAGLSLFNEMCRKPTAAAQLGIAAKAQHEVEQKIHMDLASDTDHLPVRTRVERAGRFFAYLIAFMAVMSVIGLIPTVAIFVVVFMRLEGPERWSLVLPYAVCQVLAIAFDYFMSVPWPPTILGKYFPELKAFIPSL
jgi:Tripartite tricarboxylate transporter TctB family